jgi:hypothetical protein
MLQDASMGSGQEDRRFVHEVEISALTNNRYMITFIKA